MTKLYSDGGLNAGVFGGPIFSLVVIVFMCTDSSGSSMVFLVPVLPMMLYWLFTFRHWKKIYYENESLYIYNVFSKEPIVVQKENIGGINKVIFYNPNFYKLVYYDENKDAKYVYFYRNGALDDFSDLIDKINESYP
ncbi:MAG TPA: hypothetical protein VIM89_07320 [Mucilaginibacter sp.]